jgi:DeoR family transcriptional regulator of aga operon
MRETTARRQAAILEILSRDGFTSIPALTGELGASRATIRRDLAELDRLGRLRRTYGGAVASDSSAEVPYRQKLAEAAEAKMAIARAAARLVEPGMAIGLTGGSTTLYVARSLPRQFELTVVTNALTVAMELAGTDMRVIVAGGELRGATFELVGPLAEGVLRNIHLDLVFVGVDGLSAAGGLTTHNPIEAQTNRWLIERGGRIVAVADARKLGRRTFAQIVPIERVDAVITDGSADRSERDALLQHGVEVIIAA